MGAAARLNKSRLIRNYQDLPSYLNFVTSLTLTTLPKVPSPKVARILSAKRDKDTNTFNQKTATTETKPFSFVSKFVFFLNKNYENNFKITKNSKIPKNSLKKKRKKNQPLLIFLINLSY